MANLGQRPKQEFGGTRRRILDHARQAFNERGVTAVPIREIARELDLSPGNVSYHFATKEALVAALVEYEHAENNALVATPDGPLDFARLDQIIRAIMLRDLENQWLMRDCVGLLTALPSLRSLHRQFQHAREARIDSIVARLIESGLLDGRRTKRALPELRRQILTQIFFWLPAAILTEPDRDPAEQLDAHARAVLALFRAYCTSTGQRRLEALLKPIAPSQRLGRTTTRG
ncbi:MAG: TetR/AcrR family transcriptional regulator [Candidatus Binatia bacterium]